MLASNMVEESSGRKPIATKKLMLGLTLAALLVLAIQASFSTETAFANTSLSSCNLCGKDNANSTIQQQQIISQIAKQIAQQNADNSQGIQQLLQQLASQQESSSNSGSVNAYQSTISQIREQMIEQGHQKSSSFTDNNIVSKKQ